MLTNSQMTANRFANWARYRKVAAKIQATLEADGVVQIIAYGRVTECKKRHAGMFKANKTGVYIQRGKGWDCLNFSKIAYYTRTVA